MYRPTTLAATILVCLCISACREAGVSPAVGPTKPKPCLNEPRCVEVAAPAGQTPTVTPHVLRVKKTDADFQFGLNQRAGGGNTYVIFKCQGQSVHPPECRSPAVDRRGDPVFVSMLTPGQLRKLEVAAPTAECLACADEACIEMHCSYPYMVVDVTATEVPPLDPVIIIDPN